MSPDTPIVIDRAHYDLIVANSRDLKYLCREVEALRQDVTELKEQKCPCDAVAKLQEDSANLRGRITVAVSVFGLVAGWIGSLIPSFFGRG